MVAKPVISLKSYPFVRLLFPLMAGIIIQWYISVDAVYGIVLMLAAFAGLLLFVLLPVFKQYSLRFLQGIFIWLIFLGIGITIAYTQNIKHRASWFGNFYTVETPLIVTIKEPLQEKKNSFKAIAEVTAIQNKQGWQKAEGQIIVYFKKDGAKPAVNYGTRIIINKSLQNITNSGNPGTLDYKRFCLFQGITHQVFLSGNDFALLKRSDANPLQTALFKTRDAVIACLQQYIPGKKEQAVAEALLIGYRNDLDRDLVQAYSNTGVVHIIAISGLHLAMIYGLLEAFFSVFKRKHSRWLKPAVIIFVLWVFTLIAGAAPSIMRAAVMFTAIVIGDALNRKTNMYNTLAASAFVLLVINPFYLWDVGFQLSYAAVLSIVIFMKPVYNWLYCKNKILDAVWKLNAITLSAQVLTIPIILFHFHQFSTLFLISNFIAVPLSGLILYGELLLLCFSWLGFAAKLIGAALDCLIFTLNGFIERTDSLSFSVINGLQVSIWQMLLLYAGIIFLAIFLFYKHKGSLIMGLVMFCSFFFLRVISIVEHNNQHKIVVYNIPKHVAIDFIAGNHYCFAGDTAVIFDDFLRNFNLSPGRILNRLSNKSNPVIPELSNVILNFHGKSVMLLNSPLPNQTSIKKIPIDLIIVSKNPKLYIADVQKTFDCKQMVFDSSNPMWKIEQWKKDCNNLHLRFHLISTDGAFEMNL